MASTVPRLHGAVELLLTGDQHKACTSFNQQACKNTTSVAKGKRKIPQKIAPKCAKILKKTLRFGGPKIDLFWGLFFTEVLKKNTNPEADPKTGQFLDPQNGGVFSIFCAFWRNFLRYFPLAFCYGRCILTCLLVETGAGLVLVSRQ